MDIYVDKLYKTEPGIFDLTKIVKLNAQYLFYTLIHKVHGTILQDRSFNA